MINKKRVITAIVMGVLTGVFCVGSLLLNPPPGVHPEIWFVIIIFYSRILQGFVIGIAEGIKISPAVRGAFFGLIFSVMIAAFPFHVGNKIGATVLIVFGIIYGIITDLLASWIVKTKT